MSGALPTPYYSDDAVTIYHGDCREILPLLESVDAAITDPPYGVNIAAWDKRTPHELVADLLHVATGPVLWFGAAPQLRTDLAAFDPPPERTLIWAPAFSLSHTGAKGIFYRWHPVYAWRIPDKHQGPRWDVLTHSTDGRNVWNHPATKPIALMRTLVGIAETGATVLDPFMGSGTTLRAAKDIGRKAIGIEIEERYCEVAANRMAQQSLGLDVA